MSSVQVEPISTDSKAITFQDASLDIWDKKYRLKSKTGEIIDHTIDDTYKRVARAVASIAEVRKQPVEPHRFCCLAHPRNFSGLPRTDAMAAPPLTAVKIL